MFWNKNKESNKDEIQLVLLKTTQDQYKFLTIKTILEEAEIPFIVKDSGSGGYMRIIGGTSVYPTDILVEKSMFERANKLIEDLYL